MNKTAVITGARRGFGLALAKHFSSEGWSVAAVIRNNKGISELQKIPNCLPIAADITSDNVQTILHESLQKIGTVNVLINNAGVPGSGIHLRDTLPEKVLSLLDVHCVGALRVSKAVMPFFPEDGVVINVSSRFGSVTKVARGDLDDAQCSYAYRIAKAAQNMLTQCMCREFKEKSIKICSIHPGRLKTESSLPGADRTAEEAAGKIFTMLDSLEHGKFFSLFEENIEW